MKNAYRDELTELLDWAGPLLASIHTLEFKNVFGAVARYVDGNIFISCGKFGVALRLPPETLDKVFKEDGAEQLRYFPNGHVKKEYAVLPRQLLEDRERFRKLVDESVKHVCGE
ncbi:MAG: TfoX/Sxy family protein [Chloroflexi bacterium]|nr:TfoX/Sxy family protein [Chloroflexota bacterium]